MINIPPRRSLFVIAFLSFWLAGWTFGGLTALSTLFSATEDGNNERYFLVFWLCGWAVGWVMVCWKLIWDLLGMEILAISTNGLARELRLPFFSRVKNYQSNSIKNLRWTKAAQVTNSDTNSNPLHGAIHFDYGRKTIVIAKGVDPAEGHHIISTIESISAPYSNDDRYGRDT